MAKRDFFISFNSADRAHAEAINTALRDAGYSTHFHLTDIEHAQSIMGWMRRSLPDSVQVMGLASPDYMKDEAEYSELERIVTQWGDPLGLKKRLLFVELKPCDYNPFDDHLKRITETSGQDPVTAAATLLEVLAEAEAVREREARRVAVSLPEIHNFDRERTRHFMGRDESLAEIHRALADGQVKAITQTITGLGGVGKTTLATEYVHRFGTADRYAGVWWVPAETESGLIQSLGALAERLGHPPSNDLPGLARLAVGQLTSAKEAWLVVFDNVPNPDALRYKLADGQKATWVPGGQTRVLITSRWKDFGTLAETTPLDQWSEETTADYLLEITGRDDRPGAAALARTLGGLPLAADQAAAFLKWAGEFTFADYAAEIDALIQQDRPEGDLGDYEKTVYATLATSIERLPGETQDLLCLLAWLSPDGVELKFLRRAAEVLPERLAGALSSKLGRANAIGPALSYSLLTQKTDGGWGEVLILHRMTQTVLRAWQANEGRGGWDVRAARIVNGLFPGGDAPQTKPQVWPLCRPAVAACAGAGAARAAGGGGGGGARPAAEPGRGLSRLCPRRYRGRHRDLRAGGRPGARGVWGGA